MVGKPNKRPVGFGLHQPFSVRSSQNVVASPGCDAFHVVNPGSYNDFIVDKSRRQVFDEMRSGDPAMPLLKIGVRRPALSCRMSDSSVLQPPEIMQIVDVPDAIDFVSVDGMGKIKNRRHDWAVNPFQGMTNTKWRPIRVVLMTDQFLAEVSVWMIILRQNMLPSPSRDLSWFELPEREQRCRRPRTVPENSRGRTHNPASFSTKFGTPRYAWAAWMDFFFVQITRKMRGNDAVFVNSPGCSVQDRLVSVTLVDPLRLAPAICLFWLLVLGSLLGPGGIMLVFSERIWPVCGVCWTRLISG